MSNFELTNYFNVINIQSKLEHNLISKLSQIFLLHFIIKSFMKIISFHLSILIYNLQGGETNI